MPERRINVREPDKITGASYRGTMNVKGELEALLELLVVAQFRRYVMKRNGESYEGHFEAWN